MTPEQFAALAIFIRDASISTLLAAALVGAIREWWVPGPVHRRQIDEAAAREREWRELALGATRLGERAIDVAGQRTGTGGRRDAR